MRLRVGYIDFDLKHIRVWNGKGSNQRITTLAPELSPEVKRQIAHVKRYLEEDVQDSRFAGACLPERLSRQYSKVIKTLSWQFLCPAIRLSMEPATHLIRRHHIDESLVNKIVKQVAQSAAITKSATPQTLRHSFATHLLQNRVDIRIVQSLLGHSDAKTTEIYTQLLEQRAEGVRSPSSALLIRYSKDY